MATIQDKIDTIEEADNYIAQSLIIKSYDNRGLTVKWLEENADPTDGTANRKERYFGTALTDQALNPLKRAVETETNVNDPR